MQLSDLQLVALVPMEKSNAALVEAELEQAVQRTGRPRLIVSDQGSDLKKGIADFQSWYPRTAYVPDVAHYGATLLEHAWDDEPRWQQFIKELQSTSAQLRQTKSAYLLAPRMRAKARFMNVHVQLRFARRVLKLLQRYRAFTFAASDQSGGRCTFARIEYEKRLLGMHFCQPRLPLVLAKGMRLHHLTC